MNKQKNLLNAKKNKNDEFYTKLEDIEECLKYFKNRFRGKIVYCNCDCAKPTRWNLHRSAFYDYFKTHWKELGYKEAIFTYYDKRGTSVMGVKLTPTEQKTKTSGWGKTKNSWGQSQDKKWFGDATSDEWQEHDATKILVEKDFGLYDGDFRSKECQKILDTADIVVTNPPFSLFKEYIDNLYEKNKRFIIIGNKNAINYLLPRFKNGTLWLGPVKPTDFETPTGLHELKGLTRWFTNMEFREVETKQSSRFIHYTPEKYPKFDNYDAINVDRVGDIPTDYYDCMGVPITYLDSYDKNGEFEIVGITYSADKNPDIEAIRTDEKHRHNPILNGEEKYPRIIIRRKQEK